MNFTAKVDMASLVLRLFLGAMFFLHGAGKLWVVGMEVVIPNFIEKGFPAWTAYASSVIEIAAGLMLVAGFYTRYAVLLLVPLTIGILIYHFPNGWVFHNEGGGYEHPQLILISLVSLFFLGGGKYSIIKNN